MEGTEKTNRKKILIAEDEQDLREALFVTLAAHGYEVVVAKNGEEALEMAYVERPDLVVLDLMMPKKNGHEVLEELRKDEWGATAKVLVLTSQGDMDTLSETLEKGGHDYLVKSDWSLEEIAVKVRGILEL